MMAQSPLFAKTESFMLWLFPHTVSFPKHERFRLAKRIDDSLLNFHHLLVQASRATDKISPLQEADVHLHLLRVYFRLAVELKYTTPKQYEHASTHLEELGKLLGGWQKKA
jgi:hypothetical protein